MIIASSAPLVSFCHLGAFTKVIILYIFWLLSIRDMWLNGPRCTYLQFLLIRHCCGVLCSLSRVQLFATQRTVACQPPLPMGFSRQEEFSELPFQSPGDLPDPGIRAAFPVSSALADRFFSTEPPGKSQDEALVDYIFQNGCANLHFYSQCMWDLFLSNQLPVFNFIFFFHF